MKKGWKITRIILASVLILIVVGPFLVPIPPLETAQPPQQLADPDSQFVEITGLDVHYKKMGSGEPVFILLHGFGANTFSWREVMAPFADYGTVIAYDRPAFGLTERPLNWEGINPYSEEGNLAILLGLLDTFEIDQTILVGNSAGGTLATAFTLAYPERVKALIEVDAAIYMTMPNSPLLDWLLNTPQLDRIGPLIARFFANRGEQFLRDAYHDPSILDENPEIQKGYFTTFRVDNWDRALWEHTQASDSPNLADRLDQINMPVLVITGDDDRIVPPENSIRLAEDIPGANLVVIEDCGHVPHEECPNTFMQAVDTFLDDLLED